ncbi:MAG TPA: urate hydroxylase PuuD [Pyrinomonadaceae bacterium]
MLIESLAYLPASLITAIQDYILAPTDNEVLIKTLLRWTHIVAGIAWIGLLYFFNLVNVNFMKTLDAPTKGKVIPELMPRALFWFRWGAVATVLIGLTFFAMYILPPATQPTAADVSTGGQLGIWLAIVLITYAILFYLYRVPALTKDGRVLAVVIAILVIAMSAAILYFMGNNSGDRTKIMGNEAFSIAIGGGIGILMMLNVWGIIWPAQKRIIAWTKDNAANGTPIPAESAVLARRAFLASRTNAWLSLPVLFLMATSHRGEYTMFGK